MINRTTIVESMDNIVRTIKDNTIQERWLSVMPEKLTTTKTIAIASDDKAFEKMVTTFMSIFKNIKFEKPNYDVKSMHKIITCMNNENAYNHWIYIVPDGADDKELDEISKNKELRIESSELFVKLCNRYFRDGLYIDNELYL